MVKLTTNKSEKRCKEISNATGSGYSKSATKLGRMHFFQLILGKLKKGSNLVSYLSGISLLFAIVPSKNN